MNSDLIRDRLTRARNRRLSDEEMVEESVALARELDLFSRRRMSLADRREARRIRRMVDDEVGKMFTVALADRIFRSASHRKRASQYRHLLRQYGIPKYPGFLDRQLLRAGAMAAWIAPGAVMPVVLRKMRSEARRVVLRARRSFLSKYLEARGKEGFRVNINHLGEAVLGEEEAARRLETVVGLLGVPEIDYLSVKLSSIFSQIDLADYDSSLEAACERLRRLFREAKKHPVQREDGGVSRKFVNLDMEEYRDVRLTVDAFKAVLDEPEFQELEAGIVLQAYLPDSFALQRELTEWAQARREAGGAPVKLRLVKGANLAMEQIVSEAESWPLAPYANKTETDANFKRMVAYGCRRENAVAVRLGIGSHNLFDIAYALLCREVNGVESLVEFAMLEGMANHQARALCDVGVGLVLYAPIVRNEEFHNALAYLIRRLDENTTSGNFLRDSFSMRAESEQWRKHAGVFRDSAKQGDKVQSWPNRSREAKDERRAAATRPGGFRNEADTDWTVPESRVTLKEVLEKWSRMKYRTIPLVVGAEEKETDEKADGFDPSIPDSKPYQVCHAGIKEVEKAMDIAVAAQEKWGEKTIESRRQLLGKCADILSRARPDLIGAMILDGGKSVVEADAEVSEAIDFARYYATAFDEGSGTGDCRQSGRGVVVVVPPWNFPLAIPAGGVFAALMAGNSVILKPSPETPLVAWELAQRLWEAGVPGDVLQFIPCADDSPGRHLVSHPAVDTVIFTGSLETAGLFTEWKPEMRLLGETSGKNAIVVTANADRDEAVRAIVHSAFSHSGQKCSAASLAILEAEIYDSWSFRRQLRDAAESLQVGPAWDPGSRITPLIHPPSGDLERALTTLEEGEEWLLEPRNRSDNPRLWSPGIRLGVQPGSFMHKTECFGPVLGLMRAKNLAEAIELQNAVEFGLTAGIQSLDEREIRFWRDRVQAGNLYINRSITGAIVRRQPFGGWKSSAVGPGAKAGGPDYVYSLAHVEQERLPDEVQRMGPNKETNRFLNIVKSYLPDDDERQVVQTLCWNYAWALQRHFLKGHDPTKLRGELNVLRYRRAGRLVYRFNKGSGGATAVFGAAAAAKTTEVPLDLSLDPEFGDLVPVLSGDSSVTVKLESEEDLGSRLGNLTPVPHRLRVPGGATEPLLVAARAAGVPVDDGQLLVNGRLELRHWFLEQAISHTRHRYGNILQRRKDRR